MGNLCSFQCWQKAMTINQCPNLVWYRRHIVRCKRSVAETAAQNHVQFATNTPVANIEMRKLGVWWALDLKLWLHTKRLIRSGSQGRNLSCNQMLLVWTPALLISVVVSLGKTHYLPQLLVEANSIVSCQLWLQFSSPPSTCDWVTECSLKDFGVLWKNGATCEYMSFTL